MARYVVGQILTFISYLIFWISRYMKLKKNMLAYDNACRIIAILSFLCLQTYDGVKSTVFAMIINIFGNELSNSERKKKRKAFMILLLSLTCLYIASFSEIAPICLYVCGIFNLYGVIMCDAQGVRLFGLIGSGFYALFLLFTKNYTGFVCELICAIVMLTSYIKYKKKGVCYAE